MKSLEQLEFKKYRWFFTSSGKLVVGGKSAEQNDELLKKVKSEFKENFCVMHTAEPGSPFAIINTPQKELANSDIEEAAIFTACFSRAWRSQKKKAIVDIFSLEQLFKDSKMKQGTWGVIPPIKHKAVQLSLVLTIQEGSLRAVPEKSITNSSLLLAKIKPGKIDKTKMIKQIQETLKTPVSAEEILAALPAGGVSIVK